MSLSITFPFDDPSDYSFGSEISLIEDAELALKLIGNNTYSQLFQSPIGFTFDNTKIKFNNDQISQIQIPFPNGMLCDSTFDSVNLANGLGILIGTLGTGASISNDTLNISVTNGYLSFQANGNLSIAEQGAIKFRFLPNYTVAPISDSCLFGYGNVGSDLDYFKIVNTASGHLLVTSYDSNSIIQTMDFGTWSPNPTTHPAPYEIEFDYDFSGGNQYLFIDGILLGITHITLSRTSASSGTTFMIGNDPLNSSNGALGSYNDFIAFGTVQHIANYTPGYDLYPYQSSVVYLPVYNPPIAWDLVSISEYTVISANNPKFTIGTSNGTQYWWNGTIWELSNGSYSQANYSQDIANNLASLINFINPITTIVIAVYFSDSYNQESITSINADYIVQAYPTDNPTVLGLLNIDNQGLLSISDSEVLSGSDSITYILSQNNVWYWWNGTVWAVSDGSYTQSNPMSVISANISTFYTAGNQIITQFKAFLHSSTGLTTPKLQSLTIGYTYGEGTPDTIDTCMVWGYIYDLTQDSVVSPITITLNQSTVKYKINTMLINKVITVTPGPDGYWEVPLIDNQNMYPQAMYIFTIDGVQYTKRVLDVTSAPFYSL